MLLTFSNIFIVMLTAGWDTFLFIHSLSPSFSLCVLAYKRPHPSILCAQTPHSYDLQEQRANESYRISGASVFVTESEYKHNSHTTLIILEPSHFFQLRVLFCLLHFIHHSESYTGCRENEKPKKRCCRRRRRRKITLRNSLWKPYFCWKTNSKGSNSTAFVK